MDISDLLGREGTRIRVTPVDGSQSYEGVVRSVHETGVTVWLDADKKDEGEVRTAHLIVGGPASPVDATAEFL